MVVIDMGSGMSPRNTNWLSDIIKNKPNVQICYVPLDIDPIVSQFPEYINETCSHLNNNVVHTEPVVGNMLSIMSFPGEYHK